MCFFCLFFLNDNPGQGSMEVSFKIKSSDFIFYEMIFLIEYFQISRDVMGDLLLSIFHRPVNVKKPRSVFQEAPGVAESLSGQV